MLLALAAFSTRSGPLALVMPYAHNGGIDSCSQSLPTHSTPLAGVDNRGYRGKIQRRRTLVAQVFSLADSVTKAPQFNPAFIDRVRKMEFPQLMFLPEKAGVFEMDSMLRLDEVQSIFVPQLEARQFCLGDEVAYFGTNWPLFRPGSDRTHIRSFAKC
jgi:hypothetical protein